MEQRTNTLIPGKLSSCVPSQNSEPSEIISQLAVLMIKAQMVIAKAYKNWKVRQLKDTQFFLADIYFPSPCSTFDEVYCVGDFSKQPWKQRIRMKYSYSSRSYTARVKIHSWSHFKFIVNERFVLSNAYLTANTRDGHLNNIFLVNESRSIFSIQIPDNLSLRKSSSVSNNHTPQRPGNRHMKRYLYSQMARTIKSDDKLFLAENKKKRVSSGNPNKSFPREALFKNTKETRDGNCPKYTHWKSLRTRSYDNINLKEDRLMVNKLSQKNLLMKKLDPSSKEKEKHLFRNYSFIAPKHNDFSSFKSSTDDSSDCEGQDIKFIFGSSLISKSPDKPSEDSCFTHPLALGVADGVGGWAEYGVDSSKFSNELMTLCHQEVANTSMVIQENGEGEDASYDLFSNKKDSVTDDESSSSKNHTENCLSITDEAGLCPNDILSEAYQKVKATGSSTACVLVLDQKSSTIKASNLGDSGFFILRYKNSELEIVQQSEEQQHSFNAPYQLTKFPRGFAKKHRISGYYHDTPDDADSYTCKVEVGDIILLATDGLFDNLYTKDILDIIKRYVKKLDGRNKNPGMSCLTKKDTEKLAKTLTTKAWRNSLSSKFFSPFGKRRRRRVEGI